MWYYVIEKLGMGEVLDYIGAPYRRKPMSTVKKRAYDLTCDMADAASFYSAGGDYEGECKRQLLSAWDAARSAEKTGSRARLRLAVSRWRKARTCFEQDTGYSHQPRKGRGK